MAYNNPRQAKMQTKTPPEIYREDGLYHLTLHQQAGLAYAFTVALDRISDPKDRENSEQLMVSSAFLKRYPTLLERADAANDFTWRAAKNAPQNAPQNAPKDAPDHGDKASVYIKHIEEYLKTYLKDYRNYFVHYLHKPDKIKEIAKDKVFNAFFTTLQYKAVSVWRNHHQAWLEGAEHDVIEATRKQQAQGIDDPVWTDLEDALKPLTKSSDVISMPHLLLFLSIFLPKGEMTRLLNALYACKQNEEHTEAEKQTVWQRREVLTALCLREAHDLRSQEANIVAAMTILDQFARRYGLRDHPNGDPICNKPTPPKDKKTPDICTTFKKNTFIRMMVAVIEACNLLPGIDIARSFKGKPTFEKCHRQKEIYIEHSSIAICCPPLVPTKSERTAGQLGVNALKVILLFWLAGVEGNRLAEKASSLVQDISKAIEDEQPPKEGSAMACALPAVFANGGQHPQKDIKASLAAALGIIQYRLFTPEHMSEHRKATAVLWWLNRRLPQEKRFSKDSYNKALWALNGDYNEEAFLACLPDNAKLGTKQVKSWAKRAHSLKTLHERTRKDFLTQLKAVFGEGLKEPATGDQEAMQKLGECIALRAVKQQTLSPEDLTNAWQQFSQRFRHHASPPAQLLWQRLNHRDYPDLKRTFTEHQKSLPFCQALNAVLKKPPFDRSVKLLPVKLYSFGRDSKNNPVFTEKGRECYSNDRLLLAAALKIAASTLGENNSTGNSPVLTVQDDFTYEAELPVEIANKTYKLVIHSNQARRSYVSIHPTRLKNVLQAYFNPSWKAEDTIPFVEPRTSPRPEDSSPVSWMEAEGDMERERTTLIMALLKWEKELASKQITSEQPLSQEIADDYVDFETLLEQVIADYVNFEKLLKDAGIEEAKIADYNRWRNWAFHQAPEKAFRTVTDTDELGELGELYNEMKQAKEERQRTQKRKAQKRKAKK